MFTTTTGKPPISSHLSNLFKPQLKKIDFVVFSAMPEELTFLVKKFSACAYETVRLREFNFKIYEYNNKKILIAHTGLGTTFASTVITLVYNNFHPEYLLFSGTAGAVNPNLKLRDVVIAEKAFEAEIQGAFNILKGTPFESCLTHPLTNTKFPSSYSADEELLQIINNISCADVQIYKGTVVSSNTFPAPKDLFEKIKSKNPYTIDMETSAFYQVGWLLKARVLAIRGVSNTLNYDGTDDKVHKSDVEGSAEAAAKVALKLIDVLTLKYSIREFKELDMKSKPQKEASLLIEKFKLQPHPEGGYYARTFQSTNIVKALDEARYANESRSSGTSIYYLLEGQDFSAWHRLKSDEIWHFYKGGPIKIHIINKQGTLSTYILGDNITHPEASFQIAITAGDWFAAELIDKSSYSFVGCTVTPGFEFQDFELADRIKLTNDFPKYSSIISQLTRSKKSEIPLPAGARIHSKL